MKTSFITPILFAITSLLLAGCSKDPGTAAVSESGLAKVKVGYIGITCEAPLYSAYENGFFRDEGIEVEWVKCEWSQYKDVLALGGFDITHHLIMMFLKPLEQGLDVKMTAGVHTGCLRVQTGINSEIRTAKDLKGKRIGVPGMGTPPFIFANRVMGDLGMDPGKDVEWRVYPAGELGLALEKGEVDAIADSEPIGTMLIAEGKVKNVADQGKDKPYADEYCCAVIANGKWARANPDLTAKATRAILKGAKWVQANPRAAARLSVEKKYLASNPELNTSAIANLNYLPSISGAEKAILGAATAMKNAGMLSATTDVVELAKRAWLPQAGITDQWIEDLKVDKVAFGQLPPDQTQRLLAELGVTRDSMVVATCCAKASKIKLR
ncbi:MAG TPA: ABC transporter substrate-binding protein [Planctomycetota bacterium]|nr:ABC transporter substrate-binding protein [Planctomycetota bacterium]